MTVEFYLSQEVDYINERRALYRVARLLYRYYGRRETEHFVLVANVPELASGLTQLDAMLFGQKFVALLDFKNYPDPIEGRDPDRSWYVKGTSQRVKGGQSNNPYKQAKRARYVWSNYLREQTRLLWGEDQAEMSGPAWHHLNVWILFHPYLHPKSRLMHPGNDHLWLNMRSIDEIVTLAFEATSKLCLTPTEMRHLTQTALAAQPWPELQDLLDDTIGYLHIPDPAGTWLVYPVRPFDTLTLGRSRHQHIRINSAYTMVSGQHARLEVQQQAVRLYDADSKRGTFVAGHPVDSHGGVLLDQGDLIFLGGTSGQGVCQIRFETRPPETDTPLLEATTNVTEPLR